MIGLQRFELQGQVEGCKLVVSLKVMEEQP